MNAPKLPSWVARHEGLSKWLTDQANALHDQALSVQSNPERRARYNRKMDKAQEHIKELLKAVHSMMDEGAAFNFFSVDSPESKRRIDGYGEMTDLQKSMFYGAMDLWLAQYALAGLSEKIKQIQEFAPAFKSRPTTTFESWTADYIQKILSGLGCDSCQIAAVISAVFDAAGREIPDESTIRRHRKKWGGGKKTRIR